MLMKVFSKGQVVIPSAVREELGISVGDMLDVALDRDSNCLRLTKHADPPSHALAGALAHYAAGKPFPDQQTIRNILRKEMTGEACGH